MSFETWTQSGAEISLSGAFQAGHTEAMAKMREPGPCGHPKACITITEPYDPENPDASYHCLFCAKEAELKAAPTIIGAMLLRVIATGEHSGSWGHNENVEKVTQAIIALKAERDRLREMLQAIGGMPDGFCVCFNDFRNPMKPEYQHTGECRDARALLSTPASAQKPDLVGGHHEEGVHFDPDEIRGQKGQ